MDDFSVDNLKVVEVVEERCRNPVIKAHTSFPKETLSYRWVISSAEAFLRCQTQVSVVEPAPVARRLVRLASETTEETTEPAHPSLKSPSFSVPLHTGQTNWYLQIINGSDVFLCQGSQVQTSLSCSSLCSITSSNPSPRILICDCTFSILDPSTDLVKHNATLPDKVCMVNEALKDYGVTSFVGSRFIFNDTLTIQVDATLLCISDPVEVVNEKSSITSPNDYISKQMKVLYKDKSFTNVTIKCADEEFKVHKAILASQSPVFKTMFQTDMKEKSSNVLEISDMEPAVVSDVLEFMYTGNAPNIAELARDLLNAANKYDLPDLLRMCENELTMTITVDNVSELVLAYKYQATNLKKSCLKVIKSQSAEVYKTEEWKQFLVSLSCDDLLLEILG